MVLLDLILLSEKKWVMFLYILIKVILVDGFSRITFMSLFRNEMSSINVYLRTEDKKQYFF